jgi:hypothetical protein
MVRLALGRVRTYLRNQHPRTGNCAAAYLFHTPISPPRCHLKRAPFASPPTRHVAPRPFHAARGARVARAARGEGRAAPLIRKDPVAASYGCPAGSGKDDAAKGGSRREATFNLLLKHPIKTVATYV